MNNVVNSLLNGFSSMLALGQDPEDRSGCACAGSQGSNPGGGCCKNTPAKTETVERVTPAAGCCGGKGGHGHGNVGPTEIESMKLIYSTLTGTAKTFAAELERQLQNDSHITIKQLHLVDITEYDNDDLLTETSVCVFLLSSYNVEGPLDWFTKWLRDLRYDWRVDRLALQKLRYAVCGLGDSAYGDEFNVAAGQIDKWLGQLGATRIYPLGACDKNADQKAQFDAWAQQFVQELHDKRSLEFAPTHIEYDSDAEEEVADEGEPGLPIGSDGEDAMLDLEDMGMMATKLKSAKANREREEHEFEVAQAKAKRTIGEEENGNGIKSRKQPSAEAREMVSPMLHKNLTKQGYKIVGSHSGVKICRWTKAALRGRGFCYKHSFYGIQSHLCMETTPSLACANKCVFCWRHHTNPVGTTWRWKVDDPKFILDGAMENHYKMIKQLKGVPGVKAERFQEASTIKHCALSLVGEPIFYPHINEFVRLLHERNISSFLVTNAQFPDKIKDMELVTQLYVSIDAGTKEGLKKIDRPLFRDFWERFIGSLEALADKGQRTVYRMTLVKEHNTEEIDNYVELVRRGRPSFIEVKGVTYCGYSGASNLTMANVPYHHEVVEFCKKLVAKLGPGYEIAAEHAHSCSILIAQTVFKIDGEWYTHIDYPKFFELVKSGKPFNSLDYVAKTPDWAVFGAAEGGFDPEETRFYRKNRKVVDATTDASVAAAAAS
ncbi:hypothetical protein BX666DRAFT_1894666 [Dichotomocladium elegans]|nr:hypothetical protein BX666DRAFT_1894666 [Dichotomocladium elegans]